MLGRGPAAAARGTLLHEEKTLYYLTTFVAIALNLKLLLLLLVELSCVKT